MTASYTVEVRNSDAASANRIHSDEVARRHGFRGGLVPGVVTYGLMCPAVVVALGSEWLERGETVVRFVRPIYDGDRIDIVSELTDAGATVRAVDGQGADCAVLTASLWPAGPHATEPDGLRLTPLALPVPAEEANAAGVLRLANRFIVSRFDISPWIHAGSRVRQHRELRAGEELELVGAVTSLSERRRHKQFELDLLLRSTRGDVAAQVQHTVVYELAAT